MFFYQKLIYMKCFNNGTRPLISSERTQRKAGKELYTHQRERRIAGNMQNYNGTICYDASNNVKKMHSYYLKGLLHYGYNDCSYNCPYGDAAAQTQWNFNMEMNIPANKNLVDISCNFVEDSSCNIDFSFDDAGAANGYVKPAAGETSIIDPSNVLFGDEDDCIKKKYMEHVSWSTYDGLSSGYYNDIGSRGNSKIKLQ